MSLIEEAAKRLQQLQHAGIAVPVADPLPQQVARAAVRPRPHSSPPRTPEKRVEPFLADETPRAKNVCKIDFARLQAAGFITPGQPDSKLLHEFRVIKR